MLQTIMNTVLQTFRREKHPGSSGSNCSPPLLINGRLLIVRFSYAIREGKDPVGNKDFSFFTLIDLSG